MEMLFIERFRSFIEFFLDYFEDILETHKSLYT